MEILAAAGMLEALFVAVVILGVLVAAGVGGVLGIARRSRERAAARSGRDQAPLV